MARSSFAIALLLACALFASGPAVRAEAQSTGAPADDSEARRLFTEGSTAFSMGRHEEALARFRAAYALSPRTELLYNIGSAADRLGRDREALDAYEAYLQASPSAENRGAVEERIDALRDALVLGSGNSGGELGDPPGVRANIIGVDVGANLSGLVPFSGDDVPGYTHVGFRIGGFYERMLASWLGLRIGVAFENRGAVGRYLDHDVDIGASYLAIPITARFVLGRGLIEASVLVGVVPQVYAGGQWSAHGPLFNFDGAGLEDVAIGDVAAALGFEVAFDVGLWFFVPAIAVRYVQGFVDVTTREAFGAMSKHIANSTVSIDLVLRIPGLF